MMGVMIEALEHVEDDEWKCLICEDKRGSLSAVALHVKEVHDVATVKMWVEDDPNWPPVPRMEDRKPVPEESKYGNIVWHEGDRYLLGGIQAAELNGKIVVRVELLEDNASPGAAPRWFTLHMDRGKAREFRHGLSQAIRKHQEVWF